PTLTPSPSLLSFSRSLHHRALHSFPTRRSSDLDEPPILSRLIVLLLPPILQDLLHLKRASIILFFLQHYNWLAHNPILDAAQLPDRKSTRLNSSHVSISYAVFCLKKKNKYIS